MDLLKCLPLDERYHHPVMKGWVGLFRVSWGVQESYAIC